MRRPVTLFNDLGDLIRTAHQGMLRVGRGTEPVVTKPSSREQENTQIMDVYRQVQQHNDERLSKLVYNNTQQLIQGLGQAFGPLLQNAMQQNRPQPQRPTYPAAGGPSTRFTQPAPSKTNDTSAPR